MHNAVADLTCWRDGEALFLRGDWQLDMQDHKNGRTFSGITNVPGLWRQIGGEVQNGNQGFSGTGRGTYSLTFKTGKAIDRMLLKLPQLNGARRVYFMDAAGERTLLFDSGNVEAMDVEYTPLKNFPVVLPRIENGSGLLVEMNYTSSRNGGFGRAPYIGSSSQVHAVQGQARSYTVAAVALLFIFGAVNFALYPGQHRLSALFLGCTALTVSIRILFVDSEIMFDFLPGMTISAYDHAGWLTFFGFVVFGLAYYYCQYPRLVPFWLFYPILFATFVGILLLFLTPHTAVQAYGDFYRLLIGLSAAMLVGSLVRGIKKGPGRLRYSVLNGTIVAFFYAGAILQYQLTAAIQSGLAYYVVWIFFIGFETALMSLDYRRSLLAISDLAEQNRHLRGLTHMDELTGLANRRAFEERCQDVAETLDERTGRFFVAVIDLDRFKQVNDTHGHQTGDEVLRKVADVLLENVRSADLIARWGGEEFCILLNHVNKRSAVNALERIRKAIAKAVVSANETEIAVTASIGVSMFERKSEAPDVFREADSALYISKQNGRNRLTCAWN